jgi:hypothetical protein
MKNRMTIKFAKHKSGVRSRYRDDDLVPASNKMPEAKTVGELIELLSQLPKELPIDQWFGRGATVVWFNYGLADEGAKIEDAH